MSSLLTDPYANRESYRSLVSGDGLSYFRVTVKETDLLIGVSLGASAAGDAPVTSGAAVSPYGASAADNAEQTLADLRELALQAVLEARAFVEHEIALRPAFQTSFIPLEAEGYEPEFIRCMLQAGHVAGTGPMAAVAGMVSAFVGEALAAHGAEVIVENGGDIFLSGSTPRTVAISAGESPFSGKLGLTVDPTDGVGVCTSSGTYGHSTSFGRSDAAVVVAANCALADAVATMLGNKCKVPDDLGPAVEWAAALPGVSGALAIIGDHLAAAGDIELAQLLE